MALTKEQLMAPRYKVIGNNDRHYPGSAYKVGEIISGIEAKNNWFYDDYPHLFQPVPWWADREEQDMPEYLGNRLLPDSDEKIIKVNRHFTDSKYLHNKNLFIDFSPGNAWNSSYSYSKSRPATLEEYEQYIKEKQ